MKTAYPVIFKKTQRGYIAHVPDMDIDTQGRNLRHAIAMAADAISLMGVCLEDDMGKPIPSPSPIKTVEHDADDLVQLVEVDFDAYRRMLMDKKL